MATHALTASGVNYAGIDPFKRLAQREGAITARNFKRFFGLIPHEGSRGESAYLVRNGDHYLAGVEETLGTKSLTADQIDERNGTQSYEVVAQSAVAMIVNDLITLGALPHTVFMHLAVGSEDWFKNGPRNRAVLRGWRRAVELSGAVNGGGETPVLKGLLLPGACLLSGSAQGRTKNLVFYDQSRIRHGDVMFFCESTGLHSNGSTKGREIANNHPDGYNARLSDGTTYGASLMKATPIYVPFIRACVEHDIRVHYAVNVTGHGWLKLMRAKPAFKYVVEVMPTERAIFPFIQSKAHLSDEDMFCAYNMGVGFAAYVDPRDARKVEQLAKDYKFPFRVFRAGHIERGRKQLHIMPIDMKLPGSFLKIR